MDSSGDGRRDQKIMSKPINFLECLSVCASTPELVAEFNRLTGCKFGQSQNRTALERAIDEATGYSGERDEDMAAFVDFVYEMIWQRLPGEAKCTSNETI